MTGTVNAFAALPLLERREAIEELVVHRFRALLQMVDDEELPTDISYFDLGLTSLRLTEMKQLLERELDVGIDATVLFNQPTIEDLVRYLADLISEPGAKDA